MRHVIKQIILNAIYSTPLAYFTSKLNSIIQRNNRKHGSTKPYGSIIFQGKVYEGLKAGFSQVERPLHAVPSLEKELSEYSEGYSEIQKEIHEQERFVTILLNFCKHPDDLKEIIGANLFNTVKEQLQYDLVDIFTDPYPKSENQLLQFKIRHDKYLNILNQRFVDNVLMSGIYNES